METRKPWEYISRKRYVGLAGFFHVLLTSVRECFVIEVIYSTTRVTYEKMKSRNMKTKTVSFSLVAIKFPLGLQNYWKKNFLIHLIGLNWSVCFNNFFCSITREVLFQQSWNTNINSVLSRTQRLRSRPLIQTMIPGFLKLMIFRIGTFEYSPFGCGQSTRRCLLSPSVLCFS